MSRQLLRVLLCLFTGLCLVAPGAAQTREFKPFDCQPYDAFFAAQASCELWMPDPFTLHCSPMGMELNNIGYRSTDGLLYGIELTATGNLGIVRLGADCTPQPYCVPDGLPQDQRFVAGDISPGGRWMYINDAGISPLYIIDLEAADNGDCSVYDTVTWDAGMGQVHDWAYNPKNGKLYGGDRRDGQLAELDLGGSPHARTDYDIAGGPLATGSTYDDAYGGARYKDGHIILYQNLGIEYEVLPNPPTLIAGPLSCPDTNQHNDAATCWPWSCEDSAFFMQDIGCVLCECDESSLDSPPATPICGPLPGREINNMGYCRVHQKLYGVELTRTGNIGYVEIDPRDCNVRNLGLGSFADLPTRRTFRNQRFDAGDFSCFESTLYVNRAGLGQFFYKADLTDPDHPQTVQQTVTGGDQGYVHDWAFNPADGNLYGGDDGILEGLADGQLAMLQKTGPNTWHRTDVTVTGLPVGVAFGGAWFTSEGKLVLHRNSADSLGQSLYEIDVIARSIDRTDYGRESLYNDGASCFPIRELRRSLSLGF